MELELESNNQNNSQNNAKKPKRRKIVRHGSVLYNFRKLFRKENLRPLLAFGSVIVLAAAFLVFTSFTRPIAVEDTPLYSKSYIVIGVVPGTLSKENSSGEITGFERDVMDTLIDAVYGEDKQREYTSISAQEAAYLLRNGTIDLAVGQLCSNVLKTQGLSLSTGYYTDNVCAYVSDTSKYTDLSSLNGSRILIMDTEISSDNLESLIEEAGISVSLIGCSSYEDGEDSVRVGNAAALINAELKSMNTSLTRMSKTLYTVDYRIAAYSTNSNSISLFSSKLDDMKTDGSLKALHDKYNLPYNIASE